MSLLQNLFRIHGNEVIRKMTKRSKYEQTCHNRAVRKSASMLRANNWKVKADIRGFDQPDLICVDNVCRRPDIIAKKDGQTRIIEWETCNTFYKDRGQHSIFRKHARGHSNIHTSVKICDT